MVWMIAAAFSLTIFCLIAIASLARAGNGSPARVQNP
jgi:hypothetical protein